MSRYQLGVLTVQISFADVIKKQKLRNFLLACKTHKNTCRDDLTSCSCSFCFCLPVNGRIMQEIYFSTFDISSFSSSPQITFSPYLKDELQRQFYCRREIKKSKVALSFPMAYTSNTIIYMFLIQFN